MARDTNRTGFTTHAVTSADTASIQFRKYGTGGSGVVLLHGGMMAAQDLHELASILARRLTVFVPDRRGRGQSGPYGLGHSMRTEILDLKALLVASGSRSVFGLSAGAVIALSAARELAEVQNLAVYEPPFPLSTEVSTVSWLERFESELTAGRLGAALLTVARGTGDSRVLNLVPRFIAEPLMDIAVRAQASEAHDDGTIPLAELLPTVRQDAHVIAATTDQLELYSDLGCRLLLMRGTKSPRNLHAPVDRLHTLLPDAQLVIVRGANHLAPTNGKSPRRIAMLLEEFLTT